MNKLDELLKLALDEDIGNGDITSDLLVNPLQQGIAHVKINSDGILCGMDVVKRLVELYNPEIQFSPKKQDGDLLQQGDLILILHGNLLSLLTIERTLLNFLQHLSGVATHTSHFVRELEGTKAVLLDTRKTIPGLRSLQKYAVKTGGGSNHRKGLYDMVLVKDNHIAIAGSLTNAVERVQAIHDQDPNMTIEVEVDTLDQLRELIELLGLSTEGSTEGTLVDIIMLDNMSIDELELAVQLVSDFNAEHNANIKLEASGCVTLDNIHELGETGVDFISVGTALTLNAPALDISMEIELVN